MIASKNSPQSSSPPLVVHFASGRLAARLTPYILLLLLQVLNFDVNAVGGGGKYQQQLPQKKHGLKVMVNRELLESVKFKTHCSSHSLALYLTDNCICQVTQYFTVSKEASLPVLEDHFCSPALALLQ